MQDSNHPVSKANSIAERVGKALFTKENLKKHTRRLFETCSFFIFNRLRKKQFSDRFWGKVASTFKAVKIIANNLQQ